MEDLLHPLKLLLPLFTLAIYLASCGSCLFSYPLQVGLVLGSMVLIAAPFFPTRTKSLIVLSCFLYCFFLLLARGVTNSAMVFAFPQNRIVMLEGKLKEDSSLSRSGDQLLRLSLTGCTTKRGYQGSASGVVPVLVPVEAVLVASSDVHVWGQWDDTETILYAEGIQVLGIPPIALARRTLLEALQRRLEVSIEDAQVRSLASMLLLGQLSGESFLLKDKAIRCGCAHILALSGMHLHFFILLAGFFGKRLFGLFWGKRFACIFPCFYVLAVGPKPSLLRALGMYMFQLVPRSKQFSLLVPFYLTGFLQIWLYPFSVTSFAFLYSYGAFAMILFGRGLPPIPLLNTALAIIGTGPASMMLTGTWNPAGLLYSIPATLLINLAMMFSLLTLVFGSWFSFPLGMVYQGMNALFTLGAEKIWMLSWNTYVLFTLLLLTTLVAFGYAKRVLQTKRRREYALELCLRFATCDQRAAAERGVGDDQEIWTELPALETGS
ncbi:ComEC/Rec2 family competence protein [Sphaerochaeta halotolerans]|uniref:ComEC/Rec2 family competence protein n=1 Tax=Sphaerochaeta halotolerans TaxID=2293840 RepID=UPI00136C27EF|nr:ComEC/Rec2 family competence protein [Sphaerochaeta halotolerans]MXI85753.1 hypothetical protein [Sphaerochaeta halotolerans]